MTVFEKLQNVRTDLQKVEMKKSGHNSFSKYDYFELPDFLPTIQDLCKTHGITPVITFTKEEAKLTIYNHEDKTDVIELTSPFVVCELKGANKIQCLGSSFTYLRRYLYMTAFEISESDGIDGLSENDRKDPEPVKPVNKERESQWNRIKANLKNEEVKAEVKKAISEENAKSANDLSDAAIKRISDLIK